MASDPGASADGDINGDGVPRPGHRRGLWRSERKGGCGSDLRGVWQRLCEAGPDHFPANFELGSLDGGNGFVLNGIDPGDLSGYGVASGGDLNGDGFADLVIGAYYADPHGMEKAGETYVVFGKASGFSPVFELSSLAGGDGSVGFVVNGVAPGDVSGGYLSSDGDLNDDGISDLVIGARTADPGGRTDAGETYVLFGKASGFSPVFELSSLAGGDGSVGFVIHGVDPGDSSGAGPACGDINGDGIDDLAIAAPLADPGGRTDAGEVYVLYGKSSGFEAAVELSSLDGSNGFVLNGIDTGDLLSGGYRRLTFWDANHDAFDDLVIGAPCADPNGVLQAGETYVVFGGTNVVPPPGVPEVRIQATDADAAEAGSDPGVFTVTRSGSTEGAITVRYAVGGTADSSDYFETLGGSVVILDGCQSATITVTPVDDGQFEGSETVVLTLLADAAYTVGLPAGDTVMIDDTPTKFYVVNDASQNLTYEYTASGQLNESYSLNTGNTAPRGAASTIAGDKTWVVDANRKVYVYDTSGALLGSWTAGTLASNARWKALPPTARDIWIVDAKSGQGLQVHRGRDPPRRAARMLPAASS